MRNWKRIFTLFLTIALTMGLCGTALAAVEDTGFSDVSADAWYAEAAMYVRAGSVMNGTSATTFDPDATMTRSMLATVLYRAAGSPASIGDSRFTDVQPGAYYTDAVAWASANGIVSGYGDGLFGVNDPVTREQIATILWRYDGSETVAASASFADSASISSYALHAVNWAAAGGIVTGHTDGSFDPSGNATRAQVAVMLYRYLAANAETPTPSPEPGEGGKVLIAYFSNTGNTETVAEHLNAILDADLYEIVPEVPYTSADLNYNDSSSRSQVELRDTGARPAISGGVENMADYDVIFLGYPIWNGQAPKIISTFLERYDLAGKTIVPFCTSASSGIGSSAANLHALAPDTTWLSGNRFGANASRSAVESWVNSLDLPEGVTLERSDL